MTEVSKLRQKIRGKGKEDLKKRHKEAVARKDEGRFASIYIKSKIPRGVQFWSIGNNQHLIDIIPFEAGKNIPNPNVQEGDIEWVVDLWRHRNIGPRELAFVCPAQTWNEPCPICEDIARNNYPDDKVDKIRAKRMCNYLVWVHDTPKEEKEGIKILELSHFFLQKHLDELSVSPRGGGILEFTDIDEGKSIAFTKSGAGTQNWSFIGHQFVNRTEPIPDWICDQSFPLDDVIYMRPSYEEIYEAYHGSSGAAKQVEKEKPHERTSAKRCPAGGIIGRDLDSLDQCENCQSWDWCVSINQSLAMQNFEAEAEKEEERDFPDEESRQGFQHAVSKNDGMGEEDEPAPERTLTEQSSSAKRIPRRRKRV